MGQVIEGRAAEPLVMLPGPTPLSAKVRAALAQPVRSHTGRANALTLERIQRGLRVLFGTAHGRVYVFSGAGTLTMETALVNHAQPGDRVLVISNGFFGDRFREIAETHGMNPESVSAEWGQHVRMDDVSKALDAGPAPPLVTITHVDTSTGVLADCAALARTIRAGAPDAVIVVDGVCATGGIRQAMDAWDVDVMLTGAQKALGVPPGLSILATSERAVRRRQSIGRVPAYYADLQRWDASMDDPTKYFSTHAVSLLRALEAALDEIDDEGLDARFARHAQIADALREGMSELGFTSLTDSAVLAPTLSVLAIPGEPDDRDLIRRMEEHGVIVADCKGPWAGRGIRIGHMGAVGLPEIARTVDAAAAAVESSD